MKTALLSLLTASLIGAGTLVPRAVRAQRALNNYDLTTIAQSNTNNNGYNTYLPNGRAEEVGPESYKTTPPEGYLSASWQCGTLRAIRGNSTQPLAIRYNLQYNLMEVRDSSNALTRTIPLDRLEGFSMQASPTQSAQVFTAVNFRYSGSRVRTFMQELHPTGSKLQLLAWYRYAQIAARTNAALGVEIQPAQAAKEVLLMMRPTAEVPATEVTLGRKAVLRLFGPQAPQVEAYAKGRNLSFDDANQVVELVTYYNSLP